MSHFWALVFLQEVPGTDDSGVGLTRGSRHVAQEGFVAALSERIRVAERAQKRTIELLEHRPRRDVCIVRWVIWARGYERRKDSSAGLIRVVGERSVVTGSDFGGQWQRATTTDDLANGEHGRLFGEPLPL